MGREKAGQKQSKVTSKARSKSRNQGKSSSKSSSKPSTSARSKALTAKARSKDSAATKSGQEGIHRFDRDVGFLSHVTLVSKSPTNRDGLGIDGEWHIIGSAVKDVVALEKKLFAKGMSSWQKKILDQRSVDSCFLQMANAPVWILRPKSKNGASKPGRSKDQNHYGLTSQSQYAVMRDRVGAQWQQIKDVQGVNHLGIFFHGCSDEEQKGALVGLELAGYRFQTLAKVAQDKPALLFPGFAVSLYGTSSKVLAEAKALGESVNLARHLVNLDASKINPVTYAEFVLKWFKGKKGVKVDIWGPAKLLEENMNLIYGVGQGAVHQSHMVHIKYRPTGKSRIAKPIAFVGKGVTFDTGGLDIKPPSGMRLMKKDMGGSASVMGLAHWLVETGSDVPCDLYLALAENAVDQHSFRPGDVITARNGLTVEIHNTDAEGRLVMADVLDVATSKVGVDEPAAVIDVSTLTGAMRIAVGTDIAGMFSNHDSLADLALSSGTRAGDPAWRLPLWDNYKSHLKSTFADLANSSDVSFGSAISAALFLQRFVRQNIPWLHFDLFCWADRAHGAYGEIGGNGQGVQLLADLLSRVNARTFA